MQIDRKSKKILEELSKRSQRKLRLDPETALFDKQRAFVMDDSRLVAACCSRRAGKSFAIAFKFAMAALRHDGCIIPYITVTREDAKNILHPAFRELDRMYQLGLRFRENNGDIVFPNDSKVILRGASTQREIEKLRGPKYPVAGIDEAQGFGESLNALVDEVLGPATLDYNGQIMATGTPNAACAGPFRDLIREKSLGWSSHGWTLLDNPHLPPNIEKWLKDYRSRRGWSDKHPGYLREYCGVWVRDAEGMVYEYKQAVNLVDEFRKDEAPDWEYTLGIDLGFNDPTAFVVMAYSQQNERVIVLESYKETDMIPSAVAAEVASLNTRYDFTNIVADTSGFGKGYVEEMKKTYSINVRAAKKTEKNTYISMLNGDLRTGALKIVAVPNKALLDEISLLQWDIDSMNRGSIRVDDKRFDDHLTDAMLYAWRACGHHGGDWVENEPLKDSRDYWEREEKKMWDDELKRMETRKVPFWEDGWSDTGEPEF